MLLLHDAKILASALLLLIAYQYLLLILSIKQLPLFMLAGKGYLKKLLLKRLKRCRCFIEAIRHNYKFILGLLRVFVVTKSNLIFCNIFLKMFLKKILL